MVERSLSSRAERLNSLSISEHGYNNNRNFGAPYRNHSGHSLSASHHGHSFRRNAPVHSHSMGGGGGSASETRGCYRNKSFNKPALTSTNSGYDPLGGNSTHSTRSTGSFQHSYKKPVMPAKNSYVAMDCEMVGTVTGESVAARVVLIDWKGRPVMDTFLKPTSAVADYRTFVSGITEDDLVDAPTFEEAVEKVQETLHDKILVGHGVDNDLRALGITHPWLMTRDTAYYQPFMRLLETSTVHNAALSQNTDANNTPVWGPRKLKDLAKEKLQRDIQVAGKAHCPVEDAAAALDLYKSHRPRWEACMSTEEKQQQQQALQMAAAQAAYEASLHSPNSHHHAFPMVHLPQHRRHIYNSSSPPSSFATSRTASTSSILSSGDDLSLSGDSYADVSSPSKLDQSEYATVASNAERSSPNDVQLHTGYRAAPAQRSLSSAFPSALDGVPVYQSRRLGSSANLNRSSLDSWSHHGPIGRSYHRSESLSSPPDYNEQRNEYRRPQLQRHVSMGYPSSSNDNHSYYSDRQW
jgi:RNA exonuclease 4